MHMSILKKYSEPASTLWLMQEHIDSTTERFVERKELIKLVNQINCRNISESTIDGYRRALTIIGVLGETKTRGVYEILIKNAYRFTSSDLQTYASDVLHERNTEIWPAHMKRFNPIKFVTDSKGNVNKLTPRSHMTTEQKELFSKNFR